MFWDEEDGIITAAEARNRSKNGVDDSLVREEVREMMKAIKFNSPYGHTQIIFPLKWTAMQDQVKSALENWGYEVLCTKTTDPVVYGRDEWTWSISWDK